MSVFWLWKIRRRVQQRGYDLSYETQRLLEQGLKLESEESCRRHRALIRMDRICCGRPPFEKREGHPLEMCNAFFGLETEK